MKDFSNVDLELKEDKWYQWKGVKPPERTSHGVSEDDIDDLIKQSNSHNHKWLQRGNFISCNEGPNEHGKNIGVYKRLKGTNKNGEPILEDI